MIPTIAAHYYLPDDGLPTAGETNELNIAENGRSGNRSHARSSLRVGFDVTPDAGPAERRQGGSSE